MRSTLPLAVVAALAGCSTAPIDTAPPAETPLAIEESIDESGPRWITLDADAIATARAAGGRVVEVTGGIALVELDARDLRLLSEQMHAAHHRCGGFMLHDSLVDGRTALRARPLDNAVALVPTYTLDNARVVQRLLPALEEPKLRAVIAQLSSLPTRFYNSPTGIAVPGQLRDIWAGYATAAGRTDLQLELFTHAQFPQKSVIATLTGTTKPNEIVVIGGHLDSITQMGGNAPGADDDASGVATLTEVLRVLLLKGFRPERTLKFMAYAAEEIGLRGSRGIVADAQAKQLNVVGVLQLDMTNYKGSPEDIYLISDFTNADQNTFLGELIDAYVGATWGTDACGYACSDHASWTEAGFPSSMPAESRFADMNPNLHSPGDTLEVSGNTATHALKFARLATAFAAELAKGSLPNTPPTIAITAPAADGRFTEGEPITLTATAADDEDGSLATAVAWSSSVDGSLGGGGSLAVALSPGTHVITASVKDSAGAAAMATASVEITVAGGSDGGCATGGGGAGAGVALAGLLLLRRRRR